MLHYFNQRHPTCPAPYFLIFIHSHFPNFPQQLNFKEIWCQYNVTDVTDKMGTWLRIRYRYLSTLLRLKLCYFGHVMRAKRSLERDIMLGQVEAHRKQGKPQMRWLDSIKEATGLWLEDLREAVQDWKKWRMLVEEKTRDRVRTNVKWIQEKAMANHSCTAKLA